MQPQPLLVGRMLRAVGGLFALYWGLRLSGPNLESVLLILLGLSFLVGAIRANPGCEITALPNLLRRRQLHWY